MPLTRFGQGALAKFVWSGGVYLVRALVIQDDLAFSSVGRLHSEFVKTKADDVSDRISISSRLVTRDKDILQCNHQII